jgi:CRP/FNR family cyclic AMP-dependent transcriptional regulator
VVNARTKPGLFDIFDLRGRVERQPNILAHLSDEDKRQVLSHVRRMELLPKKILFRQGDLHKSIFLINSGLMRTFYNSPSGREITLAYWQPGNFVGGPDVFGESVHMWSGIAVDHTEVMELRGKDLRKLMTGIPELGIGIAEALVFKGKCFSSLVQMLGTGSVSERLAQLLLMLAEHYGNPDENGGIAIAPQFTHEDLAHMVGASRQWVTTTLNRLQKSGIVKIRKRQVVVLKPDLLSHYSNG